MPLCRKPARRQTDEIRSAVDGSTLRVLRRSRPTSRSANMPSRHELHGFSVRAGHLPSLQRQSHVLERLRHGLHGGPRELRVQHLHTGLPVELQQRRRRSLGSLLFQLVVGSGANQAPGHLPARVFFISLFTFCLYNRLDFRCFISLPPCSPTMKTADRGGGHVKIHVEYLLDQP